MKSAVSQRPGRAWWMMGFGLAAALGGGGARPESEQAPALAASAQGAPELPEPGRTAVITREE